MLDNTTSNATSPEAPVLAAYLKDTWYWLYQVPIPVVHIILCIVVWMANALVIIAFCSYEKLRTITNYFIVNLACSDFLIGISVMICRLLVMLENSMSTTTLIFCCLFKFWLGMIAFNAGMLSVLWVAIERYIKLFYALRYEEILTSFIIKTIIIITWLGSISISSTATAFHHYEPEYICNGMNVFSKIYSIYISVAMFVPFTCIMVYIYGSIYLLTRRHRRCIAAIGTLQTEDDDAEAKATLQRRKDLSVAIMMAYIVMVIFVCYTLYIICNIIGYDHDRARGIKYYESIPKNAVGYLILESILAVLYLMNSAINPAIYHWKNADFRHAFHQILGYTHKDTMGRNITESSIGGSTTKAHGTRVTTVGTVSTTGGRSVA